MSSNGTSSGPSTRPSLANMKSTTPATSLVDIAAAAKAAKAAKAVEEAGGSASTASMGGKGLGQSTTATDLEATLKAYEEEVSRGRQQAAMLGYIAFVIVFLFIVFLQRDVTAAHWMEVALEDNLFAEEFPPEASHIHKTFYDIGAEEELWQWLGGVLVPALNNSIVPEDSSRPEEFVVLQSNRRVGAVRLRQLRVTNDSCIHVDQFEAINSGACYDKYSGASESQSDYGPGTEGFTYSDGTLGHDIVGRFGDLYPGQGGFVRDLAGAGDTRMEDAVTDLMDNGWIDRSTRVVLIQMVFYNINLNHFTVVTAVVEFLPGGNVIPWVQFRPFRISLYSTSQDIFRAVLEGIFVLSLIYYAFLEGREFIAAARSSGKIFHYFRLKWNVLDSLNIILFCATVILTINFYINTSLDEGVIESLGQLETYVDGLHDVSSTFVTLDTIIAFNMLLSFLVLFKYLQWAKRMQLLWDTLGHAVGDLTVFLAFFFIVLMGMALFAFITFGAHIRDFTTFDSSISMLMRMTLGEFDYEALRSANRFMAPIFFFLFIVLIFFTLMNIFLAILNDAYADKKDEQREEAEKAAKVSAAKLVGGMGGVLKKATKSIIAQNSIFKTIRGKKGAPTPQRIAALMQEMVSQSKDKGTDFDIDTATADLVKSGAATQAEADAVKKKWSKVANSETGSVASSTTQGDEPPPDGNDALAAISPSLTSSLSAASLGGDGTTAPVVIAGSADTSALQERVTELETMVRSLEMNVIAKIDLLLSSHPATALPAGWEVRVSSSRGGRVYYYHLPTGRAQWTRPGGE